MTAVTTTGLAVYGLGLAVGLGTTGIALGLLTRRPAVSRSASGVVNGSFRPQQVAASTNVVALVLAVGVGTVCYLATGWLVAAPIGALAAYGLPRLMRQTSTATSIAKIEAVATWTEMLQGTLAASAGLSQAIIATAELSPAPIRNATEQLAAQIQAGVHPRSALLRFADEVGDPCADRVVCALLLAFASRAQRLGDLLGALADSTREEVSLRLRIETSRSSIRSGVRTVVVFSVLFAGGLAVLDRSYLAPFDSAGGQVVLAVVGALYAAGLTLMVALARPPKPVRLLGPEVVLR
ncbi:MAG: type II secretion system F family protein [Acidimicrobiales bacterium]|jgi:Flp pilus assembly protein TadB